MNTCGAYAHVLHNTLYCILWPCRQTAHKATDTHTGRETQQQAGLGKVSKTTQHFDSSQTASVRTAPMTLWSQSLWHKGIIIISERSTPTKLSMCSSWKNSQNSTPCILFWKTFRCVKPKNDQSALCKETKHIFICCSAIIMLVIILQATIWPWPHYYLLVIHCDG